MGKNNKKTQIIIIIAGIIIVGLSCFVGFMLGGKYFDLENKKQTQNNIKIDTSKDWVYPADYKKDVINDSYETQYKQKYYVKDIIVPYLNINSSDAKIMQSEIKNVYDEAIAWYNKGVNDKTSYVENCNYESFINGNILSVNLLFSKGATDIPLKEYYTFNINLQNGKKMSYEQIYQQAGFNSNNLKEHIEKAINKALENELESYDLTEEEFNKHLNITLQNYADATSLSNLKYFLSDNNQLNIILDLSIPAGDGQMKSILVIE